MNDSDDEVCVGSEYHESVQTTIPCKYDVVNLVMMEGDVTLRLAKGRATGLTE